MTDYYQVLGIRQSSSTREIKKSFRKKAKEIHPDLKSKDKSIYEEEMRMLLKAYQILTDPAKRTDYDRTLSRSHVTSQFNYREYLRKQRNDLFCQSKLIFFDLLHNNYHDAVQLYKYLATQKTFFLDRYLSHEDYMDCAFLLAEAFEMEGEYIEAWNLYKKIYLFEIQKPYFRHFVEEVVDRLRNLVCFKMQDMVKPSLHIDYLQNMIEMNLSKKYNAFFYKKIAEIYSNLGKNEIAIRYLHQGLEQYRKLSGVKKLKEKIGYK